MNKTDVCETAICTVADNTRPFRIFIKSIK